MKAGHMGNNAAPDVRVQQSLSLGLQPEHVVHDADCCGVAAGHGFDDVINLLVAAQDVAQHAARQLQGVHNNTSADQPFYHSSCVWPRSVLMPAEMSGWVVQTGHSRGRSTPNISP